MAAPAAAPFAARRANSWCAAESLRACGRIRRPQGRAATPASLVRHRAARGLPASPALVGRRAASVATAALDAHSDAASAAAPPALRRARQDVLEPDVRLREKLTPRPNTWSDGFPYVPDEDLICLRVVHHGHAVDGWANAGGCSYADDGCSAPYPPGDAAAVAARGTCALPVDEDDECPVSMTDKGMPELPASWAVRGGPRETIYFDPATARAAIVTVGGLCPGLNDIIRALVQALESYGLPAGHILGIRYGFRGFYHAEDPPIVLTSTRVDSIHLAGGTILGTSRGGSDIPRIVDAIAAMQLSFVFVVGGNGGNAAAEAIHAACMERDLACAVVGLPKSIDNDILLIDSCFGFATAVSEAVRAILAANVEARSMHHGVGLVKLMGRSSGFIAAQASIASGEVDVCIIPEAPFVLERVLAYIYERLRTRGHCTVVVAEGAAQEAMRAELVADGGKLPAETDPSGNPVLLDVGRWLKDKIKAAAIKPEDAGVNGAGAIVPDIKYISPAYMIRSVPAGTVDKVYCRMLSHSAVHGAFAGYSGFTAGLCSQHYVYLPSSEVVRSTRRMDPRGRLYRMMRAALGQPEFSG